MKMGREGLGGEGFGFREGAGRVVGEKKGRGQKTRSKFLPVICDLLKCAALPATDQPPDLH